MAGPTTPCSRLQSSYGQGTPSTARIEGHTPDPPDPVLPGQPG